MYVRFCRPKKLAHTIAYTFRRLVRKIMVSLLVDVFFTDLNLEWKAPDTTPNSRHNSNLDYGIVSNPVRNRNRMKNIISMFMKLIKRIICVWQHIWYVRVILLHLNFFYMTRFHFESTNFVLRIHFPTSALILIHLNYRFKNWLIARTFIIWL